MADFVYPYSLPFFMDILPIETVEWDIVRFDEFDSMGTGHDIQAELADPKWTARMSMRDLVHNAEARKIAAKVRKLDGSAFSFMVCDPSNPYPADDPKGVKLGNNNVQVMALGSNGTSLMLKNLPANFKLTAGDKGQINFGTGAVYFFEFSEDAVASVGGATDYVEVWPHVPVGIAVNQTVILKKPACKMSIKPDGFRPGRSQGVLTTGIAIDALEHI